MIDQSKTTRQATDTEMLDWLSDYCYLPEDHPIRGICVLIPESTVPLGEFTTRSNDYRKILRDAIQREMNQENEI